MGSGLVKILTWNVAGRVRKLDDQIQFMRSRGADIVTLQEVTEKTLPLIICELKAIGYSHTLNSFEMAADPADLVGPRKYGQVIASRYGLTPLNLFDFDVPWRERVLSCLVDLEGHQLELHTTHIPPGSSNGWVKVETFEGIYGRLAQESSIPRILTGDFNSPNIEYTSGKTLVFGEREDSNGNIVPTRGRGPDKGRWSAAERSVLFGLAEYDLEDVFIKKHGYSSIETSWHLPQKPEVGRRFDHIFASSDLNVLQSGYSQCGRVHKLSDHAAHWAIFRPQFLEVKGSTLLHSALRRGKDESKTIFETGGNLVGLLETDIGEFTMIFDNGKDMRMWELDMVPAQKEMVLGIMEQMSADSKPHRWMTILEEFSQNGIGSFESGW
jgi:exodeoxyribonuclease III